MRTRRHRSHPIFDYIFHGSVKVRLLGFSKKTLLCVDCGPYLQSAERSPFCTKHQFAAVFGTETLRFHRSQPPPL